MKGSTKVSENWRKLKQGTLNTYISSNSDNNSNNNEINNDNNEMSFTSSAGFAAFDTKQEATRD
jgi:hypothetical protein